MTKTTMNMDIIMVATNFHKLSKTQNNIHKLEHLNTHSFNLSQLSKMTTFANLNRVSEPLHSIPKPLHYTSKIAPKRKILGFNVYNRTHNTIEDGNVKLQISRRLALGFSSVSILGNVGIEKCIAEDNGLWIDGPLPVRSAVNKIANEETGTRSFLKTGVYMANIGTKGSAYRLRRYAFDLIAMEDLLSRDAWNYVRQYLRLKSTFMYFDFDKVISAAPIDDKQPLTDLANRLFDSFEKLEAAARKHDNSLMNLCYQETAPILQEVMTRMA